GRALLDQEAADPSGAPQPAGPGAVAPAGGPGPVHGDPVRDPPDLVVQPGPAVGPGPRARARPVPGHRAAVLVARGGAGPGAAPNVAPGPAAVPGGGHAVGGVPGSGPPVGEPVPALPGAPASVGWGGRGGGPERRGRVHVDRRGPVDPDRGVAGGGGLLPPRRGEAAADR